MELRQLEYFSELCRVRSFTKAAENLNVAQPSVTKAVQQLEDELGVQLVDRNQRPLWLTEAGQHFYTHVREILHDLQDAVLEAKTASKLRKAISFGAAPLSAVELLKFLEVSGMKAENIFYNVISLSSVEICDKLLNRELDLGWVFQRDLPPELDFLLIERQEAMLLLPEGHPLSHKEEINFGDLRDEPFAMMVSSKNSAMMSIVVEQCQTYGFTPRNSIVVNRYHPNRSLAIECVRAGYGVALSPEYAVRGVSDIAVRHMSPPLTFGVGLAWYKGDRPSADVRSMIRFIQEKYPPFVGKPAISTNKVL